MSAGRKTHCRANGWSLCLERRLGRGLFLLACLLLSAFGVRASATEADPTRTTFWDIEDHKATLARVVGSAPFVAFGESVHGSGEFADIRADLWFPRWICIAR
jgi:hypothetical protein